MQLEQTALQLSIVTPVYQAEGCIEEFHRRMTLAASGITADYEIIFVNDGSTDRSLEKLIELHTRDPRVVVIDLARNFGQAKAIRTGLDHAEGRWVFVIDDDLEEQPEWLEQFYAFQAGTEAEVVFSVQSVRRGGRLNRMLGKLFFFFMQKMLRAESIANVMTARLMSQAHVRALRRYREHNASLTILSRMAGCRFAVLSLAKALHPGSSYNLRKRVRFMITHIASASTRPLTWLLPLAGLWMLICAAYYGVVTTPSAGLEKLLILTGIGCILSGLGVIGLYLSEIGDDVRGRPMVVIRNHYNRRGS